LFARENDANLTLSTGNLSHVTKGRAYSRPHVEKEGAMNTASEAAVDAADPPDAPKLNPHLDRAGLAETFRRAGRVQIRNLLTDSAARRLHHTLEHETPWGLIFNEGKKTHKFAAVSAEDHQDFAVAAWERAHRGFQYFYHHYPLLENRNVRPKSDHYLAKFVAFLTSPFLLSCIREITGVEAIAWVSSTATLYKPLDFLSIHDDDHPGDRRLVAYALNLTPTWRPDWGGALQFYKTREHVEEGYLPAFNTLNLFRVPQLHSVTQVSSFGGLRYVISGWFERAVPGENVPR
jgi:Rps23 Pro-64 3,4-dihydroxylase Tpa1-like proline 4-hydroxylase